jgi:hypothetical protein
MRACLTVIPMFAIFCAGAAGQTSPPSFQSVSRQADAARDAHQLEKAVT